MRVLLVGVLALLGGCAGSSYVVLQAVPEAPAGSLTVETSAGQRVLQMPGEAATLGPGMPRPLQVPPWQLAQDFAGAQAALPPPVERYQLYFEGAGLQLTTRSEANLGYLISRIRKRAPVAVSVIGHTDRLGGLEVNRRTGLKRAEFVASRLRALGIETIGVLDLQVRSHGERDLLVTTPDGWAEPRNRRVEVLLR